MHNFTIHKFPHGPCIHKKETCTKYSKEDLTVKCEDVNQMCEEEEE